MDKVRSDAGNFMGTFRLGTKIFSDVDLIQYTRPGRYTLACRRDNTIIWAGPIWSRTYASDAKTVQLTAQTYESIYAHIRLSNDFIYASTDQSTIVNNFVGFVDTGLNSTLTGMVTTATNTGASGLTRSVSFKRDSMHYASAVLEQMSSYDDGVHYSVDLINAANDTFTKPFRLIWGTPASSGMYFDYPGNVAKWWYSENAARAGVIHTAKTNDPVYGDVFANKTNTDLIGPTDYPGWSSIISYSDVPNITALQALADRQAIMYHMPIANPTFELAQNSLFDGWNKIGQNVSVRVQDARFPTGQVFTKQMLGWSLTPADKDQTEVIRLQLEGEDR
jgi:hypothetical protein